MMAEGKQELEWDLSNSILAVTVNTSRAIQSAVVQAAGGRPRQQKPIDFTKMNPYRR